MVESVGLHGVECWIIYYGTVKLYGGECWVTWWDVGLYGRVLGYLVGIVL